MRIVIDTNVLVSAAIKEKSRPANAVQLARQRGTLLKSDVTEQQLFEVVGRPYFAPLISAFARNRLKDLIAAAETVTITERVVACRDPTDDKFLEVAVNGHADLILTGDNDLLVLNPFRGLPVLGPVTFLGSKMTH